MKKVINNVFFKRFLILIFFLFIYTIICAVSYVNAVSSNIESTIKEKLKNEKEAIILVSGSKKYIKIVNEMIERYFNKYRNNKKYITVINCFEVEEFDDDIRDILYEHEYIINTSGINKIEDVFEIYKEKQAN